MPVCAPHRQLRHRSSGILPLSAVMLVVCIASIRPVTAQEPANPAAVAPEQGMIKITLPPETELKTLIDFVSLRLGVQILYDETIAGKRLSINAPQPIPAETLLELLKSALKMKGFALVDADVKGWLRVVPADDLSRIAEPYDEGQPTKEYPGTAAVTQTFSAAHLAPDRIKAIIDPFLSQKGANAVVFPDKNLLIVTDYASNLKRISRLIAAVDQAGPERTLKFYPVEHINADQLALQVTQSMASRLTTQPQGTAAPTITADKRTNQLMIVGTAAQIEEVLRLTTAFDVALEQQTEIYTFRYINAERVDRLVRDIFEPLMIERLYRSSIDPDDNLLIATGTEEIHKRIEWFKNELDIETKRPGSGVKFYRLKYANAEEVLGTLQGINQHNTGGGSRNYQRGVSSLGRGNGSGSRSIGSNDSPIDFVPGPNTPNQPGQQAGNPPALRQPTIDSGNNPFRDPGTAGAQFVPGGGVNGANEAGFGTIVPGRAQVSVDPNTNSIIVIADRSVQQVYEELIKSLDRRRPQVMLEAKIVILDTSDDFSLGVEISGGDRTGLRRLFQFTSFGLSTVTPTTGALALIPGRGFNWTLVDPENADAVIRALSTHRRAKIVSAPQILVNDNATGTLASVTEVPFTSVNASNTVATTSFAGFAEAGTTIEATPRITDDDHLELEYSIALNSFSGTGSGGVPPPRQTDEIQSTVVVPDGYTVIVGGLTRKNYSRTRDTVPFIEDIPVLKHLVGTLSTTGSKTTLFVFLRPVILRDDKFRDLKFLSDRELPKTCEAGNYPASGPLLIR
jgi:general secretion pathway protein D